MSIHLLHKVVSNNVHQLDARSAYEDDVTDIRSRLDTPRSQREHLDHVVLLQQGILSDQANGTRETLVPYYRLQNENSSRSNEEKKKTRSALLFSEHKILAFFPTHSSNRSTKRFLDSSLRRVRFTRAFCITNATNVAH